MNTRNQLSSVLNNSLAIRQEIQRFESVHPSIYAIYDLIDLIPDGLVSQQLRDHVVCIEDSFVNSQEWTLSRSVPDLRLGIVGSLSSGKSALVHRYLTGSYMQEESPEGGRFKKEILVDNQSYLLLIRDEGGPPELQFTAWVDAVIFVFSLENESSFNAIYNYYTKMSHYRNSAEIPLVLVGTQDAISENNPRVIDDSRARKLANDLKRCSYYETCATYGLNVERVFQDACQKIVQQRLSSASTICLTPTSSRPSTPSNQFLPVNNSRHLSQVTLQSNNGFIHQNNQPSSVNYMSPSHNSITHKDIHHPANNRHTVSVTNNCSHRYCDKPLSDSLNPFHSTEEKWHCPQQSILMQSVPADNNNISKYTVNTGQHHHHHHPFAVDNLLPPTVTTTKNSNSTVKELPTPTSTPTTSRKSRRRSNLFTPSSKKTEDKLKNAGDIGSGRAIPLKQGYLYKRSSKPLNREWKKKYVTLCDDGRLTYHPSLHDYMDDVHGKEISLQYVTVKVPGQKPRGSKSIVTLSSNSSGSMTNGSNSINEGLGGLSISKEKTCNTNSDVAPSAKYLNAYDTRGGDPMPSRYASGDEAIVMSNSNSFLNGETGKAETPNVKKRHRRMKSNNIKNSDYDDADGYEFYIVSLDNKQWHFEASSSDERESWVTSIEQQILNSLQLNESSKGKKLNNPIEAATIQAIRTRVPGNGLCVDCEASNPDWASLNLGVLMCIECSGIHRNLGSHISRVRSLDLDDWPPGHLSVMLALGNSLANSVWESQIDSNSVSQMKPSPASSREEKEYWIRAKYELKEFLAPLGNDMSISQQLVDAVCSSNIKAIVQVLAQASADDVNGTVANRDLRTPLHLACAMGNLAIAQLLIWHGANISAVDHDGRTCLAYARAAAGLAATKNYSVVTVSNNMDIPTVVSKQLIDLLISYGCPEVSTTAPNSGTLPRRKITHTVVNPHQLEKLPSSII